MLLPCLGLLDTIDVYYDFVSASVINIVERSLIVGLRLGNSRVLAGVEACAANGIVDVDNEMSIIIHSRIHLNSSLPVFITSLTCTAITSLQPFLHN